MRVIECRPTWIGLLPALLALLESGTPEARKTALEELQRMARAADVAVEEDERKRRAA